MPESEAARPAVRSIPAAASFADALALHLIDRFGGDPLALARGRILLPNARAVRSVTEAFVRASGRGLLLPRLIPVGDAALDERVGGALDPLGAAAPPPALDPLTRQAELAVLVREEGGRGTAESWRLAGELARVLDQLIVEEKGVEDLDRQLRGEGELALNQQRALAQLSVLLTRWPERRAALGRIELAERRNRLLRAMAARWRVAPPPGFTVAAGITTAAPAVAALLRTIAFMPGGEVVLPGLADAALLPDEQWEALGGEGEGVRGEPTHPQYHLKLLLDRMGIARAEVEPWPAHPAAPDGEARSRAAAQALTAARFSHGWSALPAEERTLGDVRLAVFADPASEAQGIALALREALETPERTAALVTPDRTLARRVAAHLKRWGIEADDSAGTPLSLLPPGTLLLALVKAATERLSPVPLLALLGHPLVQAGEERQRWLDDIRRLDRALRGPRPLPGLAGLDRRIAEQAGEKRHRGLAECWARLRPWIVPLDDWAPGDLGALAAGLRDHAGRLAGEAAWSGVAGRAAADLLAEIEASPSSARLPLADEDRLPLLRDLVDAVAIRPPYGQHPRVRILGLLEARLVKTDLMVLGGLNEGSWPAAPSPDPWLPAKVRRALDLPGAELRIGLSAHDFAGLLCAPDVLLTRAGRDGRSPTVSSRLLLRLEVLTGGLQREEKLEALAAALDRPDTVTPATQPAPAPPVAERPRRIAVTALDRLKADPFAFYARAVLGLSALDPLEADQDARWKGDLVHALLEKWHEQDGCDPDTLLPRADALLAADDIHPVLRALWGPRLREAFATLAEEERARRGDGRRSLKAEISGEATIAGVTLEGRADRIDRLADGRLAVLDYKTGHPPTRKQVEAGYALQLGLLGLIAEAGGFPGVSGRAGAHEYWSLAKKQGNDRAGYVMAVDGDDPDAFRARAHELFADAVGKWLTGSEPFTAKLAPAFAPYGDFDQLMRLEEWIGRR